MSSWFMPETVPAAAIRLFCFSYAGGGASTFRSWPRDDSLGVVPVQLPGRENRMAEAPLLAMDEIVEQAAQAMLPYVDAPYALFGHSLGARVGFEVARFMRRRGHALPVHLFVSGSRAPEIPEPQPLHDLDEKYRGGRSRPVGSSTAAKFPEIIFLSPALPVLWLPVSVRSFPYEGRGGKLGKTFFSRARYAGGKKGRPAGVLGNTARWFL